jgi:hypothetical protein
MESAGLITTSPLTLADRYPSNAILTGIGRGEVSDWNAARSAGKTQRACEAAMLSWLDAHEGEQILSTDEFKGDVRAHMYGEPFTDEVLMKAARTLHQHGLISGSPTFGGATLRPAITPMGRGVVAQHNGNIAAWLGSSRSGGGDTFHITGSTGVTVANRSPGAQQSVHVTTDAREQVLNIAAALEQMMPSLGLEPADQAKAFGLVGQLKEAAEQVEEKPGRVRSLIESVKQIAVAGTGAAAGTGLVALAEVVLHSIAHL